MITEFLTVAMDSESLYKVKGSKFIGLVFPVSTTEEIRRRLGKVRQDYHDAHHYCYAYVLGAEKLDYRVNDDGEPNHSAGDPILGQVRANNLTNVLVIVVRYFVGAKLGVRGLINAYRAAAAEALNNAMFKTEEITKKVVIYYNYSSTNSIMRLIDDFKLVVIDQTFDSRCKLIAQVKLGNKAAVEAKLNLLKETGYDLYFEK
ncbi:MAG: YigZ family protein [Bacteroidota bacterium]